MKRTSYIIFLAFIAISCDKSISVADEKRVTELNNKAVEYRMNNNLEKAKDYYSQAIEINPSDSFIRYELIGVYIQQDSLDKAFAILENIPIKEKKAAYYYQVKGGLYEYKGQKTKAIENYKKALELTDNPKVNEEMDLGPLVNYAMLETVAGKKEQAVKRLNDALKLSWLTEKNIEYLETFRNEFEYYAGNANFEFEPKRDIMIKTTNSDSLELVLKENHINTAGSSSSSGRDSTELYVSEKYRKGIEKLNIKTHPNNGYK